MAQPGPANSGDGHRWIDRGNVLESGRLHVDRVAGFCGVSDLDDEASLTGVDQCIEITLAVEAGDSAGQPEVFVGDGQDPVVGSLRVGVFEKRAHQSAPSPFRASTSRPDTITTWAKSAAVPAKDRPTVLDIVKAMGSSAPSTQSS